LTRPLRNAGSSRALGLIDPVSLGCVGRWFVSPSCGTQTKQSLRLQWPRPFRPKGTDLADNEAKLGGVRTYVPALALYQVTVSRRRGWLVRLPRQVRRQTSELADLLAPAIPCPAMDSRSAIHLCVCVQPIGQSLRHPPMSMNSRTLKKPTSSTAPAPAQMTGFKNPDFARTYQALAAGGRECIL